MTRTHIRAPTATSKRIRNLAAVALLAALCACGRDAVEPKLVGTWQTAVASPTGPYQLRFTTLSNGQYQTLAQGPAPVPAETGLLKAAGGKWRREKLNGGSDEGTYEFLSADSVLFKSKTETLLWSRVPNDVAAAATQPAAASVGAAQAGLLGASGTGAGAQPSAELVAAGPFGAPLAQAAAAAPPDATGSSFGSVAPATTTQPSGSGAGSPQQASTAPSGAQISNAQHARQAAAQATASAHQAAASAHQAAASAGEAADAVKAEADERIGPFRKAGSKIKNFFTGHKSDADDKADSSPALQNGH